MRVLVVEDESRLAKNIIAGLREGSGYAVDHADDGGTALQMLSTISYDLILLDLMLPSVSGEEVLRSLRAKDVDTPVLVLTARGGSTSVVELLDLGADDYLTKPFDLGELIARSRALVRRGKGVKTTTFQVGDLKLDATHQVVTANDTRIDLSPTEYRIVEYLIHRPRQAVSKRELLEHLYDFTWEHHSNVIEVHISNLRKKLRMAHSAFFLETLRGRGYRLTEPKVTH